ncbi:hypothetical protein NDU88_006542 [Pleurodeles waltl]|uniref:Uncharacterized protein n=1 Tax=Pleurodeles waltl TaxID=8319 RepID=A0AAV7LPE4_PLEWA|nr:hypothetical protein NDU88_006542 [Pleurodeles waltl]
MTDTTCPVGAEGEQPGAIVTLGLQGRGGRSQGWVPQPAIAHRSSSVTSRSPLILLVANRYSLDLQHIRAEAHGPSEV